MTDWLESRGFTTADHDIRSELLEKFALHNVHINHVIYEILANPKDRQEVEECLFDEQERNGLEKDPLDYEAMIPAEFISPFA